MDAYGRGITQADLEALPEVQDAVLWQPAQFAPVAVRDAVRRQAFRKDLCEACLGIWVAAGRAKQGAEF